MKSCKFTSSYKFATARDMPRELSLLKPLKGASSATTLPDATLVRGGLAVTARPIDQID